MTSSLRTLRLSSFARGILVATVVGVVGQAHAADIVLRTHYVEGAGQVLLNVVESGRASAPTIVFVHGLGQSSYSWMFQLRSDLARRFHLVAFDLRGHGDSGKPSEASAYLANVVWAEDLKDVLDATAASAPVVLVGWSYGTWVLMDYVQTYGTQRLSGLVLVGGLGGLEPPESHPTPREEEEHRKLRDKALSGNLAENIAAARAIQRLLVFGRVDPAWLEVVSTAGAMLPPYARDAIERRSFDHAAERNALGVPILLVAGEEDDKAPASQAARMARRLEHASLLRVAGAGHSVFAEKPALFNDSLARFYDDVLSRGAGR